MITCNLVYNICQYISDTSSPVEEYKIILYGYTEWLNFMEHYSSCFFKCKEPSPISSFKLIFIL